ncbi:hypothetical protein SDC9_204851 [bioreactor metagenome]|uniref:Uncharacterized protein n=1 Tax=bioreactor metagenome TaxID=1076179 RepID=A0A645J175_9ZZZZ
MAAEGGELRLYGLLIPDIGEDIVKQGKAAPLLCRKVAAELIEQDKQPNRFDGYRLASGIRTGNDHCLDHCIQADGNGNRFLSQQWVPCFQEIDMLTAQIGCMGINSGRPMGNGKQGISSSHLFQQIDELKPALPDLRVQFSKNFCDFDENLVLRHNH